jgi:hypothetical protein
LQILGCQLVILGFSSELDKQVCGRWLRKFLWLDVESRVTFKRIIEVVDKTKAIIDEKEAIIAITVAVPSLCTFLHGSSHFVGEYEMCFTMCFNHIKLLCFIQPLKRILFFFILASLQPTLFSFFGGTVFLNTYILCCNQCIISDSEVDAFCCGVILIEAYDRAHDLAFF